MSVTKKKLTSEFCPAIRHYFALHLSFIFLLLIEIIKSHGFARYAGHFTVGIIAYTGISYVHQNGGKTRNSTLPHFISLYSMGGLNWHHVSKVHTHSILTKKKVKKESKQFIYFFEKR